MDKGAPQKPRHWRIRKDPFETVRDKIFQWLTANPERTAKSLFAELHQHYPGQFADNQLRTLQRRVQAWRAKAILTFNDQWLEEDLLATEVLPRPLGANMEPNEMISGVNAIRRCSKSIIGRGSVPAPPEFIALKELRMDKKEGQVVCPAHPSARPPRRSGCSPAGPYPPRGKGSIANLFRKWDGSMFLIKLGKT